ATGRSSVSSPASDISHFFTSGTNTLTLTGTGGLTGDIAIEAGTVTFNQSSAVTLANIITGGGAVIDSGAGSLTFSGSNTYSGGTVISSGALRVTNDSSVGTGTIPLEGGTFQSGAAGLSFTNAFAIVGATGGTIDTQANTLTLSGAISGSGGLSKIGSGT